MLRESVQKSGSVPFWRDVRVRRITIQIVVLLFVGLLVWGALSNYLRRGLSFRFSFLDDEASFDLAEGIEFDPTDTFARAFLVGILNTVKVAIAGVLFATILGLLAGIARLSTNWLVRTMATVYVEVIRNTPLLVQLFFLYFAVILSLPRIDSAIILADSAILSNRGVVLPWPVAGSSIVLWFLMLLVTIGAITATRVMHRRQHNKHGSTKPWIWWVMATGITVPVIGWFLLPEAPITFDIPSIVEKAGGVLRVEGGMTLSSEFTALLVGLTIYTGAYIAEVVRAGIQAVPKGQSEAARSQGFSRSQILRLIVLPQAMRIIIPPLISQYLNLTKNSSLAIAIGFLDVYAVSQTMLNQSGRVVEVFLMIMGSYLAISLTISLIMNLVNRRMQIVER